MESEKPWYTTLLFFKAEFVFISASVVTIVIALIMILATRRDLGKSPAVTIGSSRTDSKGQATTYVDVAGAVKKPGMYSVPSQSHISDVISMAGGLTANADTGYLAKYINLAKVVSNEEKIYVPYADDSNDARTSSVAETPLNINTASVDQLDSLPRIGQTTAQKIIEHRPYQSIRQLVEKKILSETLFNSIASRINIY